MHSRLAYRFEPGPVIAAAKGSRFYDTESRVYVDFLLGNCCSILGHSHDAVASALARQAFSGINVGDFVFERTHELGDRLCAISGKDALRFVNSGSEAVHLAIRLARAKSGRRKILKFEGHYHGWFDEVINTFTPSPQNRLGIPAAEDPTVILEWNDREALEHCVREHAEEIACVILEPVLAHAGTIPPLPGYLESLVDLCRRHGIVVIFDECITGFRLAPGGAQERLGVEADLVIYSKGLSAGVPIGVVAGPGEIMELLGGSVYQAATYDANCLSVTAALAVIQTIEREAPMPKIEAFGESLHQHLSTELARRGVSHVVQGYGSLFQIFLTERPAITTYREAMTTDLGLHRRIADGLFSRGVHVCPGYFPDERGAWWLSDWFVSAVHGDEDFEITVNAYREALDDALS